MNVKSRTDEELGDMIYYLSQYDFEIKYSPGKLNLEADCLSRNPVLDENDNMDEQLKIVNLINLKDVLKDQEKNIEIRNKKSKLIKKKNIYYKKVKKKDKIILSEEFSLKLIKNIHEHYCHIGITQMTEEISKWYTAKNLIENIKNVCKHCITCIKNKSRGQKKFGLMSHLGPATKPFEIVSIDTVGGFGGSRSKKNYLHILIDHFTRYAYILTSKTQNAKDFIKLIKSVKEVDEISIVLADQYPGINSKELKQFLNEKNIQLVFTAVNSPFSNGLNERLNQTLVNKIRCKINEENKQKKAWSTIAHFCTKRYNETEHTITGFAPLYLMNGTDVSILPNELNNIKTETKWMNDRKKALENSIKSHDLNKIIYDKNRIYFNFKVGDMVFVENGHKSNRKKLEELRIGPFKIMERLSNSIYKIDTGHRKPESKFFHISKLVPLPTQ